MNNQLKIKTMDNCCEKSIDLSVYVLVTEIIHPKDDKEDALNTLYFFNIICQGNISISVASSNLSVLKKKRKYVIKSRSKFVEKLHKQQRTFLIDGMHDYAKTEIDLLLDIREELRNLNETVTVVEDE